MKLKTVSRLLFGIILISAGLLAFSCGESEAELKSSTAATEVKPMRWDSPPLMTIDTGKKYTAIIEEE